MKNNKLTLTLIMTLFLSAILTSCLEQKNKQTQAGQDILSLEITPESSATPLVSIAKGEITLYSNFDPNFKHGYTLEGLANPANTQAFFDFDKGEIVHSNSADIYFNVSCGSDCFIGIIDINNTKSVEIGEVEPGFQGCLKASQEKNHLTINSIPGTYSCIYTNRGNIVQILVLENNAISQNATLVFQYIIWYQSQ